MATQLDRQLRMAYDRSTHACSGGASYDRSTYAYKFYASQFESALQGRHPPGRRHCTQGQQAVAAAVG